MSAWYDYQEEVAAFFRTLDLDADTNVTVQGIRAKHKVDVVVRSKLAGIDVVWIVECKNWESKVPQEKVSALRDIVQDVGADRGFLMAESGYQPGALDAALFSNITLTSVLELGERLAYEITMAKVRSIPARVERNRARLWEIDSDDRVATGLKSEYGYGTYDAEVVIRATDYTERQAYVYGYPVKFDLVLNAMSTYGGGGRMYFKPDDPDLIYSPDQLFNVLDAQLGQLEERLDAAEGALPPK